MRAEGPVNAVPAGTIAAAGQLLIALTLVTILSPGRAAAAVAPAPPGEASEVIETIAVGAGVYVVHGRSNATFVVGSDGVLLIDTMSPGHGAAIRQRIGQVTPLPVKYVINTHFHGDHVGSNAEFGRAGVPIIAHRHVLARMSRTTSDPAGRTIPPAEPAALPTRAVGDRWVLEMPGIRAELMHVPDAHTDGDLIVWLPKQNVLVSGDVFKTAEHPFFDRGNGGTLDGTIAATQAILERANETTRIVPGHGGPGDRQQVRTLLAMMTATRARVAALVRQGSSRDQVLALRLLRDDRSVQPGGPDFRDLFVGAVYDTAVSRPSQAAAPYLRGAPALVNLAGAPEGLEAYRGRVLLLNFWATWCAPCRQEMPDLDRLNAGLDHRQAAIVGVAADELPAVKLFVARIGVKYPVLTGNADAVFAWSGALGNAALGLPYSVLLDRDGTVRWSKSGGRVSVEEARTRIESLVRGGMPPMGVNDPSVPAGTRAPDGIGVVVARSPGAGPLRNGFWVPKTQGKPLGAGARMPSPAIVKTMAGRSFDLNAAVVRQPTVLIFYRGGWCPFCNAHLRELQASAPALRALGYQILAVSSDTPDKLRATLERNKLDYVLLSDDQVAVAAKFGLRYQVNDAYLAHLRDDKGTDLVRQNGGYLLTPAAYIVDRTGKLRFAYVNDNASVRVGQDVLLREARAALQ
jgi:cyclase